MTNLNQSPTQKLLLERKAKLKEYSQLMSEGKEEEARKVKREADKLLIKIYRSPPPTIEEVYTLLPGQDSGQQTNND